MIPYEPFEAWWCCLNPRERNTLVALGALWSVNPTYIERTTFDLIVATTGESASIKMLAWFMTFYGLEYQLIPCGEDCVIDAVVFIGGFWMLLWLFLGSEGAICAVQCKLLTFPL